MNHPLSRSEAHIEFLAFATRIRSEARRKPQVARLLALGVTTRVLGSDTSKTKA